MEPSRSRKTGGRGGAVTRRFYGTGSLHEHRGAWYGKWRVHGRQVKRKLGPIRKPGRRDGLTRKQAEARLRKLMGEAAPPPVAEAVTLREAGERLILHLEGLGRKRSTIANYKSYLAVHIAPAFGDQHPDKVTARDIERFIAEKRHAAAANAKPRPKPGERTRSMQSVKSIHNYLGFLHGSTSSPSPKAGPTTTRSSRRVSLSARTRTPMSASSTRTSSMPWCARRQRIRTSTPPRSGLSIASCTSRLR